TWPHTFWSKRDSSLRLFLCDGACDTSPGLTFAHPILVPDRLAAGSRRLGSRLSCPPCGGGYVVPGLTIPVGYCWQNSRYCQLAPRIAVQLHRRPRVAPERISSVAARQEPCSFYKGVLGAPAEADGSASGALPRSLCSQYRGRRPGNRPVPR